jgi:hypothetical protein
MCNIRRLSQVPIVLSRFYEVFRDVTYRLHRRNSTISMAKGKSHKGFQMI